MKGRSKWSAWKAVSTLTKEDAMQRYIDLVKESFSWEPFLDEDQDDSPKTQQSAAGLGNAVSTFAMVSEDEDDDAPIESNPVFNWAKECDILKLEEWTKSHVISILQVFAELVGYV